MGSKNALLPIIFLYIFQTTCTIILKFLVCNFLSVLVEEIKNLKILLFLNFVGHNHFVGANKIYTFLYIKIFIVSAGLFVNLILECLFVFAYDLS